MAAVRSSLLRMRAPATSSGGNPIESKSLYDLQNSSTCRPDRNKWGCWPTNDFGNQGQELAGGCSCIFWQQAFQASSASGSKMTSTSLTSISTQKPPGKENFGAEVPGLLSMSMLCERLKAFTDGNLNRIRICSTFGLYVEDHTRQCFLVGWADENL